MKKVMLPAEPVAARRVRDRGFDSNRWKMIAALMFMTLAAGVGFGLIQMLAFLQRGSNRAAAEHALVGETTKSDYSWNGNDGALPDLLALAAIVVVLMALLAGGYSYRG